jgi:hypothetical protein
MDVPKEIHPVEHEFLDVDAAKHRLADLLDVSIAGNACSAVRKSRTVSSLA